MIQFINYRPFSFLICLLSLRATELTNAHYTTLNSKDLTLFGIEYQQSAYVGSNVSTISSQHNSGGEL